MPVTSDFDLLRTAYQCKDCHVEFATTCRTAKRCPQCAKKWRREEGRKNQQKRRAKLKG